jgi:two-component system, LuxR family, sensor kinase FixL
MAQKKTMAATRNKLREAAEKRIRESTRELQALPKKDVLELIHELEVHQVELEIQNEELRHSQAELQEARQKYFELCDMAPVGYATLDRNGFLREINPTGAELLGQESARLKGKRFSSFLALPCRQEFDRFLGRIFASAKREETELTIKHGGKAPLIVFLSGAAILDSSGSETYCQMALTDITARKTAETWLQRLIDVAQDAVVSINRRAQINLFNPSAVRMFGYDAEEVMGKKVNMLMAEPYASEHDLYIAHYEKTGEKRAIGKIRRVEGRRKSGEIFPIELSVIEDGEGSEVRYVALIRDISERVQLQSQLVEQARLAAVVETAAKVAHEIANPLNAISMTITLLDRHLKDAQNGTAMSGLKRIDSEVSRLKNLLYEFRDLSKPESYEFRPTSLVEIVEEVVALEQDHYDEKGVRVEMKFDPGLPPVLGDRAKIKQALINLCKNAEEAMPEGGTLTLRGYESKGRLMLEVSDTGIGIPEDFKLFEPFKTTKISGTGLGLVIVRQILSRHQGSLSCDSERGNGTTFTLSFPVYSKSPAEAQVAARK